MSIFKAPSPELLFKSPHSYDPRLGDRATIVSLKDLPKLSPGFVVVGHADDEGVALNRGRVGSKDGPRAIRQAFYKLTPSLSSSAPLYDLGDLAPTESSFAQRQKVAQNALAPIFLAHHRLLALGGGHDHAYADVGAFLKSLPKSARKPLVINIDAHLDLRPLVDTPHSGTPFTQLREEFHFDLVEIGIQRHSNSLQVLKNAEKSGVKIFDFAASQGRLASLLKKMSAAKRPMFFSIDMDAFSSAYAPGVSAVSPIGLDANELFLALPAFLAKADVRGFGIYEVAPPLDIDGRTAKLAAIFAQSFVFQSPAPSHIQKQKREKS